MKYIVTALHWDDEVGKAVKHVAGSFDDWFNAVLFSEAYQKHYSAKAEIVQIDALIN